MMRLGLGLGLTATAISTGVVAPPPVAPVFLPTLTTAPSLVLSTTKLVEAYSGPAVRVQRVSDDVEQDIGFTSKYLSKNAADAFRGTSDLGVKTWYDQSGNGFHQAQAAKVNQPGLYAHASYNGAPAISFDSGGIAATPRSKFMACAAGPTINKQAFTEFYLIAPNFSFNDNYYGSFPVDATTVSLYTAVTTIGMKGNNGTGFVSVPSKIPPVNPAVLRWQGGSSAKRFGLNGANYDSAGAPTAGTVTGKAFGRWNNTTPSSYDGEFDIIAYVCYPASLSDADCQAVEAALYAQCNVALTPTVKLVFDGDSRTEGWGQSRNSPWVRKILQSLSTPVYATNMGVGGQLLNAMAVNVAARVAVQYSASYAKNIVIMGGPGINDFTNGRSAAQVQTDFTTYANGINANQKLIASTVPIRDTSTTAQNDARVAFNTWLRANWATYADALVDLDALFPTWSASDFADISHFNDAGQAKWAAAFKPVIEALIAA